MIFIGQQHGLKDFEDLQKVLNKNKISSILNVIGNFFFFLQKIVELNFIVKARESKLIDLSKKNAELAAHNSEMKR